MKNILLIGCGHMGMSLLTPWLNSKKYNITVVDPKKYNKIQNKFNYKNLKVFKSINQIRVFRKFDIIIFATRPIDLNQVLDELKYNQFKKNAIIVSVIAGKKLTNFSNKLVSLTKFVRVMPNMPALISQGMNCIFANKKLLKTDRALIKKLFEYSGKTIFFKNEKIIDKATAVSGSGPGFVFYLIDSMEKAAINIGFNKNEAKILVAETFRGSINLLIKSDIDSEKLVKTVATKGGTTEAGLKIMKENKIPEIFIKLIKSSHNRAKQQGK